MKTLNVQKVSRNKLASHWGDCAYIFKESELFIRSNAKGVVNWDKATLYTWEEIIKEQLKRRVHFTVPQDVFEMP